MRGALLLAAVLLVVALVGQWNDVRDSVGQLTAAGLAGSAFATVLAVGATVLSWRSVLGGLGASLPLRATIRIFCVGQIGKYIPGSVWPVLAQMELSRDYGVSRPKSASASLVVLALAVPCGGVTAAATLPVVSRSALADYWWALAVVPLFAVVLHPPVLSRLLDLAFRLLRRPPLAEPLTARPILAGAGWLIAGFVWYGVGTWLLVRDLDPAVGGARLVALCIGAYALAWTAGFLVLVLPAGPGCARRSWCWHWPRRWPAARPPSSRSSPGCWPRSRTSSGHSSGSRCGPAARRRRAATPTPTPVPASARISPRRSSPAPPASARGRRAEPGRGAREPRPSPGRHLAAAEGHQKPPRSTAGARPRAGGSSVAGDGSETGRVRDGTSPRLAGPGAGRVRRWWRFRAG
ncbi:hypothetical protein FrEUN1fDRAFT_1180 [Parafrankia sp. EUN1f]|nr:hypothetical protein FrEUN1fDRAFT_1180 [Parafrankia sp. EUN1f]